MSIVNGSPDVKFVIKKAGRADETIIAAGYTDYEGMYYPILVTHDLESGILRQRFKGFRFEPTVYFEKVVGENLVNLARVFSPDSYDTLLFYPNYLDKPNYFEEVILTEEAVKIAYHYLLANKDFSVKLRGKNLVSSVPLAMPEFTRWGNITLTFNDLTMTFDSLDDKLPCRLATTANINLTTGGLLVIDGVQTITGDRVLVKNQTTGSQNGIYVVASGAWTRSTDADVSAEVTNGMWTEVLYGALNALTRWLLTTSDPIVLGTTSLTFSKL
jgi:hypothetical protein